MTFSDKRIVEFVTKHFVPVWESVAPVSTATFDLGDGRSLKGTVGGEIAIFFCFPDGRAFDVLPALQSPNVTFRAIQEAQGHYETFRARPEETVPAYHVRQIVGLNPPRPKAKQTLAERLKDEDAATRALTMMSGSKTMAITGEERFVVIEPSGLGYYKQGIHRLLASTTLRTPLELRKPVFEDVLEMKLVGRDEVFTPDSSPEPFMYIEEEE